MNIEQVKMALIPIAVNLVLARNEDFPVSEILSLEGKNKYAQMAEHVGKMVEALFGELVSVEGAM